MSRKTKAQLLAAQFGGEWRYCGGFSHRWEKVGTKIAVQATSPGTDQFDNPLPGVDYWMYGDGIPKRVTFEGGIL